MAFASQLDIPGRVVLLATPAHEADGGKISLLRAGAYKSIDVSHFDHAYSIRRLIASLTSPN